MALEGKHVGAGIALVAVLLVSAVVSGEDKDTSAADKVWSLEQQIYAQRAKGDGRYYSNISSEHYLGWPAPAPKPITYNSIRQNAGKFKPGEKIEVVSDGITVDGDTAISYYSTHRTVRPGGQEVDERYENIHVYVHREGEWRLVGAMSRRVLSDELRAMPLGGEK